MGNMITKTKLEELVEKYETADFIKDDPIQFPHRFISRLFEGINVLPDAKECSRHCETLVVGSDKNCPPKQSCAQADDIEISAFLASIFAYGNRKIFIKKLNELFEIMQNKPLEYILNGDFSRLKGFNYRFAKDFDVIEVFNILHKLYKEGGSLKKLFEHGWNTPHPNPPPQGGRGKGKTSSVLILKNEEQNQLVLPPPLRGRTEVGGKISTMFQVVVDYFYSNVKNEVKMGFYHLIPCPKNGGAMKRMVMLLRWLVRKGPVDLGVWDFIPQSELLIPLDVHVARISREMGLLMRSSNDFKAVVELTENLKKIDPSDPAKFDFAIFGLGINE